MDTVRATPGRLPPTISTTPNSPSVCAKLRTMPVTSPRTESGTTTRRNVASRDTPSDQDASSSRRSTDANSALNGWTANGIEYSTDAISSPSNVNGRPWPTRRAYARPAGLSGPIAIST